VPIKFQAIPIRGFRLIVLTYTPTYIYTHRDKVIAISAPPYYAVKPGLLLELGTLLNWLVPVHAIKPVARQFRWKLSTTSWVRPILSWQTDSKLRINLCHIPSIVVDNYFNALLKTGHVDVSYNEFPDSVTHTAAVDILNSRLQMVLMVLRAQNIIYGLNTCQVTLCESIWTD